MRNYKLFLKNLLQLLDDSSAMRISSGGYMPLSIEDIGHTAEGHRLIAISHTSIQNGDLMRDPEMVFQVIQWPDLLFAEPISFRNDYMGTYQEVYRYNDEGKRTHVDMSLRKELKSFASMWFRNLRAQGFFSPEAKRERLS